MSRKRPPVSKKQLEAEQYEKWRAKHETEYEARTKRLNKLVPSNDVDFFAKQRAADEGRRRGVVASSGPKPEPALPRARPTVDTRDLTLEELEALRRREEAAAEELRQKQARTGAVYNKGGYVYLSDDLLKDVQAGNTRRRS